MPLNFKSLVKECIVEVLAENLLEGAIDYFSPGTKVKDIYGNTGTVEKSYVDKQHLTVKWDDGMTSEVHYTWIRPAIANEGFDPLSQGPNIPEENPYPKWNNQMRTLEEEGETSKPTGETNVDHTINPYPVKENEKELASNPHSRYAQESGAANFDPRSFGVNNG